MFINAVLFIDLMTHAQWQVTHHARELLSLHKIRFSRNFVIKSVFSPPYLLFATRADGFWLDEWMFAGFWLAVGWHARRWVMQVGLTTLPPILLMLCYSVPSKRFSHMMEHDANQKGRNIYHYIYMVVEIQFCCDWQNSNVVSGRIYLFSWGAENTAFTQLK